MKLIFLLLQITKMFSSFSSVSRIVLILIWLRHTCVYCMEDDDIKVFEKPDSTADWLETSSPLFVWSSGLTNHGTMSTIQGHLRQSGSSISYPIITFPYGPQFHGQKI